MQTNLPLAGLFESCWKQTISRTRHNFAPRPAPPPPPPLPLCRLHLPNISPHLLLPYTLYPIPYTLYPIPGNYWLHNRRGLLPGASGKSRTGDCELLCAVLDTSPQVYNSEKLVHEVNNLWQGSQRAQRINSRNHQIEKIWTYDRTYEVPLLACTVNCIAGTMLAIT